MKLNMDADSPKHRSLLLCDTVSTEEGSATSAQSISPLDHRANTVESVGNGVNSRNERNQTAASSAEHSAIAPAFLQRAIETDYMIAPSTKEAKQNERYARKVGINL